LTVEHLFSAWQEVLTRLKSADNVILLSDFDGTLTPIVAKPEIAYLSDRTRRLLQEVIGRRKYTVGIVSGRALDDLKDRVGLQGIIYAGNYGLEIEAPWLKFVNPDAEHVKPLLRHLHQQLSSGLEAVEGAFVENKGLSLSVHYRLVEEGQIDEVRSILEHVTRTASMKGMIQVTSGKKVYEVTPVIAWHKGKVIDLLSEEHAKRAGAGIALPVFLGDDVSDREGFNTVDKRNGISIFVGKGGTKSGARYSLKSPTEVDEFLERLP